MYVDIVTVISRIYESMPYALHLAISYHDVRDIDAITGTDLLTLYNGDMQIRDIE